MKPHDEATGRIVDEGRIDEARTGAPRGQIGQRTPVFGSLRVRALFLIAASILCRSREVPNATFTEGWEARLGHLLTTNGARRYRRPDARTSRHIPAHDTVRPNHCSIPDTDWADNDRMWTNIDIITDRRHPTFRPLPADTYRHAMGDIAVRPKDGATTDDDAIGVADVETGSNPRRRTDGDAGAHLDEQSPDQEKRAQHPVPPEVMGGPILQQSPEPTR